MWRNELNECVMGTGGWVADWVAGLIGHDDVGYHPACGFCRKDGGGHMDAWKDSARKVNGRVGFSGWSGLD